MRVIISIVSGLGLAIATAHAGAALDAEPRGDVNIGVVLDPDAQSGRANASLRIHAGRDVIRALIESCPEALNMVPGLEACEVRETAPDHSWQIIHQVIDYSWFVPKLTYDIRARYDDPGRVSIERISGDLKVLKGSWYFESDGDYTVARYGMELQPGFWVPRWLIRVALRRDLPKMLLALRTRAEFMQQHPAASVGTR